MWFDNFVEYLCIIIYSRISAPAITHNIARCSRHIQLYIWRVDAGCCCCCSCWCCCWFLLSSLPLTTNTHTCTHAHSESTSCTIRMFQFTFHIYKCTDCGCVRIFILFYSHTYSQHIQHHSQLHINTKTNNSRLWSARRMFEFREKCVSI